LKFHKKSTIIQSKIDENNNKSNPALRNTINKMIEEVKIPFREMQQLQTSAKNRTGLWASIKNPKKEVMEERDKDLENIRVHIENLKKII